MNPQIDMRTVAEKEREARHKAICEEYLTLALASPSTSRYRLLTAIATHHKLTIPGVRKILIKAGLYITR